MQIAGLWNRPVLYFLLRWWRWRLPAAARVISRAVVDTNHSGSTTTRRVQSETVWQSLTSASFYGSCPQLLSLSTMCIDGRNLELNYVKVLSLVWTIGEWRYTLDHCSLSLYWIYQLICWSGRFWGTDTMLEKHRGEQFEQERKVQ